MLVNCAAYENGKKLADIPVSEIGEYLKRPKCFVWVALKEGTPEELELMRTKFGLHELAVEDAQHGHQRPKIEEYGESLFGVLHLLEVANGDINVGEADVFVGKNYVVSVRSRAQQTFLGVRERCEREPHLLKQGPSFVFYALIDAVVDRYFKIIDTLETELETVEEQIFAKGRTRAIMERLYALKQKVSIVKHAVAPLLDGVGKLHGGRVPVLCVNTEEYFRNVADHLGRINASVDDIRDMITTAMQVSLAVATSETNEVTRKLAGWAGIFAAATALVGVWGMNFDNMPELKWEYGYYLALAVIAGVCGGLYWRFKRSGWI